MSESIYAVQSNNIKGLSAEEYSVLREMCQYSNNLYNVALYNIRQHYFSQNEFLTYESNYHICKEDKNYSLLQAGVAQQTLKIVDRNFKSFFGLLKKYKNQDCSNNISIPHYRKKNGYFNLICSGNAISISNGYFKIPMSRKFRKLHPNIKNILIPYPERLNNVKTKEVRIIPCNNAKSFKIQYVYHCPQKDVKVNPNNCMAIDLGVENLATCVSNVEKPFIMDGRKIKSINQYWNKRKARLLSIAMKQGNTTTNQIKDLTNKRNRQVNDIIKKTARYIINNCIENNIGSLYVGYNIGFKKNAHLGKVNNQNFEQIPFCSLKKQLKFLCYTYKIEYHEIEESYTSKSSFVDNDTLPTYSVDSIYKGKFSGKRIKRGLYKTKDGRIINADINGAYNILRKGKQNFSIEELSSGLLASPLRIRVQ